MAAWKNTCDALYFPYGRKKLGGVHCRLDPGHTGDHWCEAEDEMDGSEGDRLSVYDAALAWASNGKDEDYMFGYSSDELERALSM